MFHGRGHDGDDICACDVSLEGEQYSEEGSERVRRQVRSDGAGTRAVGGCVGKHGVEDSRGCGRECLIVLRGGFRRVFKKNRTV